MVNYIRKFREDTDLSSLFQQSAPDNVRLLAKFLAHLNTTPFYQSGTPVHFNRYQTEEELDHAISLQSKPELIKPDTNLEQPLGLVLNSNYPTLRFVNLFAKRYGELGLMDKGLAELIKSGFIDLKFNHAYHEYRMKHEQGNQYLTREISELFDIAKKLEGVDVCYDFGEKTPTLLFKGVPLSQVDALREGSTFGGTGEFLFYATEYMRSVNAWSEKTPEGNSVFAILNPDNRYRMVKTDNRLSCFTGDEYVTEERISPSDIIYVPTKEEIDRLNLRSRK